MKALVLEDSSARILEFRQRFIERGWVGVFVKHAIDAIRELQSNQFDIVFLDHDLDDDAYTDIEGKNTGSEVARWINRHPVKGIVLIHSLNPSAAQYMKGLIKGSYYIPFVWTEKVFNNNIK